MPVIVKHPSECTAQEIQGFASLVAVGGEVQLTGLQERIEKASLLGFAVENNDIVAVAALKRPNQNHTYDVFMSSGASLCANDYPFEYGWAFTDHSYRGRGFATVLLERLLAHSEGQRMWASTRETNQVIHGILMKHGFFQAGKPFPGRNENMAPNE
jgi:GNAT superfamily N-acetyltransferase